FGYRPTEAEYRGGKVYDLPNAAHLRNHLHDPTFFADLSVMENSQEVVEWLTQNFEVYLITSTMEFKNSLVAKYDWLSQHFSCISWKKYIFCGEKTFIQADYMIDDKGSNLEKFSGKGILFSASHNVEETRFDRVNNWLAVKSYFEKELAQTRN
ncbi:MAG: 5'-nucleotidase, partial [Saprospiraceae bacterium]